jgi:hypothetical protein
MSKCRTVEVDHFNGPPIQRGYSLYGHPSFDKYIGQRAFFDGTQFIAARNPGPDSLKPGQIIRMRIGQGGDDFLGRVDDLLPECGVARGNIFWLEIVEGG